MSTKVSRASAKLELVESFPSVCPKCGAAIGDDPRRDVRLHFHRNHEASLGIAFRGDSAEPIEFAYISPVFGLTRRTWYVVAFDYPFSVITFRPDEWRVAWRSSAAALELEGKER